MEDKKKGAAQQLKAAQFKRHSENLRNVTKKRDSRDRVRRGTDKDYFCEDRNETHATPETLGIKIGQWRIKDRMKTVSVALLMALNIGVDPPDVLKPSPCARMECWVDIQHQAGAPAKALEVIGKQLQSQYERWQPRARYKQSLDPTVDDVKKLCVSLRRSAKEERVLLHYNGHGVPRPTNNGEVWVFNKNYTQYIPLSIHDLQTWLGSPSIYVFDCNAAGLIVKWYKKFAVQRKKEQQRMSARRASAFIAPASTPSTDILLAACSESQLLPMNPELPADVFTACLTTPIKMALRWFCSNSILSSDITLEMIDKIPGRLNDRRTPLGELNWIFTAITDTIAWNVLPPALFQQLFRQDLLVASLFRNFLLAERIMRSLNCTPVSSPELPPTYQHPMWQAWDLAADICLSQLPGMIANPSGELKHNPFFAEQLTAFEVWLEFGSERCTPPEQLPIVLQVLLSQAHRLRALQLLARFLDLGAWAVNLALSVGIFPYVLKLLQSPAAELKPVLVFIWAKILALDRSCQYDLVKDNGQTYFMNVLSSSKTALRQRVMCAFILTCISDNCHPGQCACLASNLLPISLTMLNSTHPDLRKWGAFCLAKLWEKFEDGQQVGVQAAAHERLCSLLTDPLPEVRAAAVYALGALIGDGEKDENRKNIEINVGLTLPVVTADGSPIVRRELVIALSHIVNAYEEDFKKVATEMILEEQKLRKDEEERSKMRQTSKRAGGTPPTRRKKETPTVEPSSVYGCLWKVVLSLTVDPFPLLAVMAKAVVNNIHEKIRAAGTVPAELMEPQSAPSTPQRGDGSPRVASRKVQTPGTKKRTSLAAHLYLSIAGSSSSSGVNEQAASTPSASASTASSAPSINGGVGAQLRTPGRANMDELLASHRSSTTDVLSLNLLRSTLYEWSCQEFTRPQRDEAEDTDPSSPENMAREWRVQRAAELLAELDGTREKALKHKFDTQIGFLDNERGVVSKVLFHPYEPVVVSCSDGDLVTVWNWGEGSKINHFSNGNPPGSRISSISLINPNGNVMLMVGSDDGVVRCWRNFCSDSGMELVSAWRALSDLSTSGRHRGAGLLTHWDQQDGWLLTSGDVPIIRVWDAERDLSVQDIPTGCDLSVSSLTQDSAHDSRLIVAGCGDGSIRTFDWRSPPRYAAAQVLNEHKKWVINVSMPRSMKCGVVSGAISGLVKIWDLRKRGSLQSIQVHSTADMTAMAVHDHVPIFATGVQNQRVKISNFDGKELNVIKYHDGFLGQRIGPVASLGFHPYKLILAAGASDSIISLYKS